MTTPSRTDSSGTDPSRNDVVHLTKHHGLGNDFLIVLDRDLTTGLDPDSDEVAAFARQICDRRRGVGADGLIVARPADGVAADMQLWNSDGSRAELSGNGLRCLGQALLRAGWVGGDHVVLTDAGERRVRLGDQIDASTLSVAVEMGAARRIDLTDAVVGSFPDAEAVVGISVGNPHVVAVVAAADDVDIAGVGPSVEAMFPTGANVHAVSIRDDRTVDMRIWERGAGATQACGSGAAAAAAALFELGLVGDRVEVTMPGGTVTIEVGEPLVLIGPACFVADVTVPRR